MSNIPLNILTDTSSLPLVLSTAAVVHNVTVPGWAGGFIWWLGVIGSKIFRPTIRYANLQEKTRTSNEKKK